MTLYLVCILSLLLSAVLRSDIEHWLTEYRTGGVYAASRAVQGSAVGWVNKVARLRGGLSTPRLQVMDCGSGGAEEDEEALDKASNVWARVVSW